MHILLYLKVVVNGGNILIYKQLLGVWSFLMYKYHRFFIAVVLSAHFLALPEKLGTQKT